MPREPFDFDWGASLIEGWPNVYWQHRQDVGFRYTEGLSKYFEQFDLPVAHVLEPHASRGKLVRTELERKFYQTRNRIHARWPRPCRECGEEFRPTARKLVRCQSCRARRRGQTGRKRSGAE